MNTVFKFETADQTLNFSQHMRANNFDLIRCLVRVEIASEEDYDYAMLMYDAATIPDANEWLGGAK